MLGNLKQPNLSLALSADNKRCAPWPSMDARILYALHPAPRSIALISLARAIAD